MNRYDTTVYLDRYHGWHAKRCGPASWMGRCPRHVDARPSLVAWGDGHFHCYSLGCQTDGKQTHGNDIVGAIHAFEGLPWNEAFKVGEELVGAVFGRTSIKPTRMSHTIVPLLEQRAMMARIRDWSHTTLFSPRGVEGLSYLHGRGIETRTLRHVNQLGYLPASTLMGSLIAILQEQFGELWRNLAFSVGLLTEEGGFRLQRRIVCFCEDELGVRYYQGRKDSDETGERRYKYLNPPLMEKYPFTVPIDDPIIPGIAIVEGIMEVLALAEHRIPALATLGAGAIPADLLTCLPQPILLCQNHDLLREGKDGWVRPGDVLADTIERQAMGLGKEAVRLKPPLAYKDMDRWLKEEGVVPFLRAVHSVLA